MNEKKKRTTKLIALVLTLALLVGITVGGTLAWLIAETEPVVNTFTVGNIQITLTETENLNLKMVPGGTITKDPTVTVKAGSEDCWLFVEVKAENGVVLEGTPAATDFLTCEIASDWVKIGAGKNGGTVYGRKVTASENDQKFAVLADNQVTVLTTVTKAMMETAKTTAPKLTFTAYAIQSANLGATTAAEAWAIYNPTPNP